jgi:hypothetical protein
MIITGRNGTRDRQIDNVLCASDSGSQLAKVRNLADEGDFGRQESVGGAFDKLAGT